MVKMTATANETPCSFTVGLWKPVEDITVTMLIVWAGSGDPESSLNYAAIGLGFWGLHMMH